MVSARRSGLFLSILKAMDNLRRDIQQAVINDFIGFALDVIITEGGGDLYQENRNTLRMFHRTLQNVPQNTPPTLPSYMAVSQSAKAKLRSQGSPRLVQDGSAEHGFVRRHSLPSSTNGKISLSPRVQKPFVQANGKGGSRSDKSLSASGDGNEKLLQPGWRR